MAPKSGKETPRKKRKSEADRPRVMVTASITAISGGGVRPEKKAEPDLATLPVKGTA
ncbi:MAG: hypothetical protein M9924_09095 [Rhizobiaceae bacterium]|nr:hypothetical protein [Rhizobiaceae bacterium]